MSNENNIQNKIDSYEKEFYKSQNSKILKYILRLIIGIFIVFILDFFVNIISKAFSINFYFGVVIILFSAIFLMFYFIKPIYKIFSQNEFRLSIKKYGRKNINEYNDKICYKMAKSIIDFNDKLPDAKWYDIDSIYKLNIAVSENNVIEIRNMLTILINGSIRKSSNNIMVSYAVKAGIYSAISQSEVLDAILIFIIDLMMIKDLVFLYGFRPTMVKMIKIYIAVFIASASAYGLETSNVGRGIIKTGFTLIKSLFSGATIAAVSTAHPITAAITNSMKNLIVPIGDSTVQGLSNGIITAVIGYQTIAKLNEEYNLQDNLKNIDLLDDKNEFNETIKDIKKELVKQEKVVNVKNNK